MVPVQPYDVERVMGRPFADVSISENYRNMVDDERIGKTYIDAREFFMTLAELQLNPDTRTWCSKIL